jgi:hypothetical protein
LISFEEARQIAYRSLAKKWARDYRGTYMVAAYGFENDAVWVLIDGALESLVHGESEFEPVGRGSTLVDKASGRLFFRNYLEDMEWFNAMSKVGTHPEDPDGSLS